MTTIAEQLHDVVAAVCPITGLSIGDPKDKATWKIHFADTATAAQKKAADKVLKNFDYEAAKAAEEAQVERNAAAMADLAVIARMTDAQLDEAIDSNKDVRVMLKRILKILAAL